MAQSRLEKIGTIFTRVQGLLRGGAVKPEDKPIWYDVYAAFPPKAEPRFDRPAPDLPIRKIFYAEDVVRAKFHKQNKPNETINLADHRRKTQTQHFIQIYEGLKTQGALDEQRIYETALDLLAEQRQQIRTDNSINELEHANTLLNDFQQAELPQQEAIEYNPPSTEKKSSSPGINISSLFKD